MLDVLQAKKLVHADIKPDNILINLDRDHTKLESIKVVDFGSSFTFDDKMKISAATPEYLPPEMLLYLENIKKSDPELKAKYT